MALKAHPGTVMAFENSREVATALRVPQISLRQERPSFLFALLATWIAAIRPGSAVSPGKRTQDLPDALRGDVGLPRRHEPIRYEEYLGRGSRR